MHKLLKLTPFFMLIAILIALAGCSPASEFSQPGPDVLQPSEQNTDQDVDEVNAPSHEESSDQADQEQASNEQEFSPEGASIGDFVWEDLNGNGLQDELEPGLAGVEVSLVSGQGEVLQSTRTDQDGFFTFSGLTAGEYSLAFSFPNTMFSTQQTGNDTHKDSDADAQGNTELFRLDPGDQRTDLDAGMVYPGRAGICPLTGLPTDSTLLANRPIFISISQFPTWATRPATGLNAAPVVFETLIDEGQTRLQALFYCGYPKNLPKSEEKAQQSGFDIRGVRSGRVFYAELAQLFGAGLIFGGASAEVYNQIAPYQCGVVDNSGIPKNIGDAGLDIESLQAIAKNCQHSLGNTQLDIWQFGSPTTEGESADKFLMHYNFLNQTRWEYDPQAGGYLRYQNDPQTPKEFTLSTDKLTGEAIVRQNLLLLEVPHQVLNRSGTIIDFDLTDERGYAWLLRDGTISKVCWSAVFDDYATSSNRYRPFLIYDCTTKEPVHLAAGTTWINVVDPSFWMEQNGDTLTAKQPFLGYGP